MKVFIDLGSYNGDTLQAALKIYTNFDRFFSFEPCARSFDLLNSKFIKNKKVVLYNAAVSVATKKAKLYHLKRDAEFTELWGDGSSLCKDKVNINRTDYEYVRCIDFSQFVFEKFDISDYIILKLDIEGMEYEVLNRMICEGSVKYINKIFCEWHYDRLDITKFHHLRLVKKLQKLGFCLTGNNYFDEFKALVIKGNSKIQLLNL
jgi:FkbM family methyltransferase